MSLSSGTRLGIFEITGLLGKGGMGEVYRARDTKLGREVAIKVLPEDFAQDEDRIARFGREAKLLAILDHPNVGTIYDFQVAAASAGEGEHTPGSDTEVHFLVMQLVEGETLSDRIRKGPLPLREALPIFVQIARGLDAAHESGIVHRDLKPANVKIAPNGDVKVLDFGIAKRTVVAQIDPDAPTTPMTSFPLTNEGEIVGTPMYMSPEQARGKEVDSRTDIWAFGCCLYEALTGSTPFPGETMTDIFAAILEREPDWGALPDSVPREVRRLLQHCLEKNPRERLRDIGDAQYELEEWVRERARAAVPDQGVPAAPPRGRLAATVLFAGAGLFLAGLFMFAVTLFNRDKTDEFAEQRAVREPIRSLAVLPFDNLMGDPEQEYFVDGMTETLVAQLAKIKGMRVISRTSAMRYKNTDKSIPTIARELGVDALVEGSILRAGNDLRITAQLIHGRTDEHLWADSYDGKLENILSLQSKVALDIAKAIQIAVAPEDARRMLEQRTIDPAVHEAVLKGRFHWKKRTKEGFERAAEHFQRAIDVDPDYAPAHAGLADTYLLQDYYGYMRPLDIMPLAKVEAERAIELDPTSAQGFASLGFIAISFEWDWERAEQLFLRAIKLDPDYPTAHHWYSDFLRHMGGRLDKALAEATLAYRLDPLSPIIGSELARSHVFRRDFAKAIEQYLHTLDLHPNFTPALMRTASCYLYVGDYDSARPYLERLRATPGGSVWALMLEARFLAAAGKREEATQIAAKALQKADTTDFYMRTYLAMVFWDVGDDKKAFELLGEVVRERAGVVPFLLPADPWFDAMRGDSRFQALLDQMNLPPLPPDHPVAILNRERAEAEAN